MREILFRGKTKAITGCPYNNGKPDGEWVFGHVFSDLGSMKIRQYETDRPECNDYEVDPETVGQYTGVNDKNGRKIFEGDIIEGYCHSHWNHELMRCVIAYNRDHFEARHYTRGMHNNYFTYKTLFSKDVIVIGNIYDNPELIGELKDD